MRLGFDLDGVVFDTQKTIREELKRKYGIKLPYCEMKLFEIEKLIPLPKSKVWNIILEAISSEELPVVGIADIVLNYFGRTHPIFFISNRPIGSLKITKEQILNLDLRRCDDIILKLLGTKTESKANYICKFDLDLFVEDNPATIKTIYDNTTKTKLLIYNRPWNQGISEPIDRVRRVNNWYEIYKYIALMEEEKWI